MPALTFTDSDGEKVAIFESCAIVQFLADSLSSGRLAPLPGPTKARAEYEKWMWLGGSSMDQLLWQIHGPGGVLPDEAADPRVVARAEEKWRAEIEPQLCAQLSSSGGPFLLGEFSAVDCVVGHCVRWGRAYGLSVGVPQLEEYMTALTERAAFVATYADKDTFGAPTSSQPKL